jgi:hypothetical protein
VRWQVLSILRRYEGLRFFAVIRDKRRLLDAVRRRNERSTTYRYHPNELYDAMVRRLFKTVLHKQDEYRICFARRGKSDRTAALRTAIDAARQRFQEQRGIVSAAGIHITDSTYPAAPCLQVADYFLWALQRLYERHDDRFIELLWPAFRTVNDIDDVSGSWTGVYYTQKRPLTLAAVKDRLYDKEKPGL